MTLLNKFGIGPASGGRGVTHPGKPGHDAAGSTKTHSGHGTSMPAAAVGTTRAPAVGVESTRVSNGMKELMWNLDGLGRGTLLDMGGAWQATLSFFIEKGFRVTTDDLLRSWKMFLDNEEKEYRERSKADQSLDLVTGRTRESILRVEYSISDVVVRRRAAVGFAGLCRSGDGDANRFGDHRVAAPRRRCVHDVSQQEAGRVSAVSRSGCWDAAGCFGAM